MGMKMSKITSSGNSLKFAFLFGRNNCLQDPTIIHFLFEVSQALHDGVDFLNIKADEHQHSAQLISRFVNIVHSFSFPSHSFASSTFWFLWQ